MSSLAPVLLVAMPQLQDPNFHRSVVLLVEHSTDGALGLVLNREGDLRLADLCDSLEIDWAGDPNALTDWGGPVEPNKGWMLFSALPPHATTPDAIAELAIREAERNGDTDREGGAFEANGGATDQDSPHSDSIESGPMQSDPTQTSAGESGTSEDAPQSASELVRALDGDSLRELAGDVENEDEDDDDEDGFEAHEIVDGVYFGVTLDTLRCVAESSEGQFRLFLGYAGWGPGQLESEMARGDWIVAPAHAECVFNCPNDELWLRVIQSLGVDPTHLVSTAGIH